MISPDMEVQWMNVKLGKVTTGPAIDLFREYTHHMMKVKEDCKEILFNPGELKITEEAKEKPTLQRGCARASAAAGQEVNHCNTCSC